MPPGYRTLQLTYALGLALAGIDKFFHLLVDWNKYLAPMIRRAIPGVTPNTLMDGFGIVQILTGVLILFRPREGAYVACVLIMAFVINLLLIPGYFDIAARDLALAGGAFALARLSTTRRH